MADDLAPIYTPYGDGRISAKEAGVIKTRFRSAKRPKDLTWLLLRADSETLSDNA